MSRHLAFAVSTVKASVPLQMSKAGRWKAALLLFVLKGSVQRNLRRVESGVYRWVWAWDCGAGRDFVLLVGRILIFSVFPFPVSTAQFKGEVWNNR